MEPPPTRRGILFVLSAPSGAGKSTLCEGLKAEGGFIYSVSCTTRAPRPGELDGIAYHFLSPGEFEARIAQGEFLEHAQVHGNRYGTLRETVLASLRAGQDVFIDIDTQGAGMIRSNPHPEIRNALVDIFLKPPDISLLRERLAQRGTESEEQIALRLRNAEDELAQWPLYQYTIDATLPPQEVLACCRAIMQAERLRARRRTDYP